MTSLRRFAAHDLLSFNNVNLDYFTETVRRLGRGGTRGLRQGWASCPARAVCRRLFASLARCSRSLASSAAWYRRPAALQYNLSFYLDYLAKWPEYCQLAEGPGRQAMGYSEHCWLRAAGRC